ncbi:hypothetical protein [Roseovarius sp.]|uniref:hypothetical protein n=1 Tax=Roseovarius sp. TaxID=1486281 RepID=UPI003BAC7070
MPKPTKPGAAAGTPTRAETLLEKTTRAAWDIIDDETAKRDLKTERLREARLARANDPADDAAVDETPPIPKTARKKARATSGPS